MIKLRVLGKCPGPAMDSGALNFSLVGGNVTQLAPGIFLIRQQKHFIVVTAGRPRPSITFANIGWPRGRAPTFQV